MALLIGGLLIIAALIVGHFEGYLMGVKVRNVTALVGEPELDPRRCTCTHEHSSHSGKRAEGSCVVILDHYKDAYGNRRNLTCSCMRYIPKPAAAPSPKGALEL